LTSFSITDTSTVSSPIGKINKIDRQPLPILSFFFRFHPQSQKVTLPLKTSQILSGSQKIAGRPRLQLQKHQFHLNKLFRHQNQEFGIREASHLLDEVPPYKRIDQFAHLKWTTVYFEPF
jgi:hypothetical protein